MRVLSFWAGIVLLGAAIAESTETEGLPPMPIGPPEPAPSYMRDNTNNQFGVAPDQGTLDGPVLDPAPVTPAIQPRAADSFWLSTHGPLGKSAFAPSGYQFFRNVKDFGAVGDGVTDDTAAINRAAATFSFADQATLRCGKSCGSSTTLSAVKPVIKGSSSFRGIAMIDANPYMPKGKGDQWYINQSNFFRQIRNIVFDMRGMARRHFDGDQQYVPTGIHWQIGQATSITKCDFKMDIADARGAATSVGIMMENGSGGVVSDLTFEGGNIGFLAGSQQFTAVNLKFTSCNTAIRQEWNWGFVWKNIEMQACLVGIDATQYANNTSSPQGVGSITLLDSKFSRVPAVITVPSNPAYQPNLVLDNLALDGVEAMVRVPGGEVILGGASKVSSWASGYIVRAGETEGQRRTGQIDPPIKNNPALLDTNGYFYRSKPQYEDVAASSMVVATASGVKNDGTGDQTNAINSLLSGNVGKVIFFPGGTYMIAGTIKVPPGTKMVGSGWSSFMAYGGYFENERAPKPLMQVGKKGDKGLVEISDFVFTTKGRTPGAVMMEWNIHESTKGSAAMWDSHFRIGGGANTDLLLKDCPAYAKSVNPKCQAASLMLHVTNSSTGYFDNVWAWVADHDLEDKLNADAYNGENGIPSNVKVEISIYVGRGVLIESLGPTWFWGCASEHAQLYQWQLNNAETVFLGHMQTETPYYQANPTALSPFVIGLWPNDPTFESCGDGSGGGADGDSLNGSMLEANDGWIPRDGNTDEVDDDGFSVDPSTLPGDVSKCSKAWALRLIKSKDVFIYGAGFYSFFDNNGLGCAPKEACQQSMIEIDGSGTTWLFNVFTKGTEEIITDFFTFPTLMHSRALHDRGFTSEVAGYLVMSNRTRLPPVVTVEDSTAPTREENAGKCWVYIPRKPSDDFTCQIYCQKAIDDAKAEGRTTNYGCVGNYPIDQPIPWRTLPDGTQSVSGNCVCDSWLVNEIADTIIEALPAIAQIACYILMSTLRLVFEIGIRAIPGVGQYLGAGMDMLATGAKIASYVYPPGEDPLSVWDNWISGTCGGTDFVPEELQKIFDILNSIADGRTKFKPPKNIGKGSGKKGDKGNPGTKSGGNKAGNGGNGGKNPPGQTGKKKKCKAPARRLNKRKNQIRRFECNAKEETITHDTIISSLALAQNSKNVDVLGTCSKKFTQACYHYSSAIEVNKDWKRLTCPVEAMVTAYRFDGKATDSWLSQHKGEGWTADVKARWELANAPRTQAVPKGGKKPPDWSCERDEYPPAYLLNADHTAIKQGGKDPTGQLVRWIPAYQNGGAANMWGSECFETPLQDLNMAEIDRRMAVGLKGKTSTTSDKMKPDHRTMTYVSITVTDRPVFTIDKFEHTVNPLPNAALNDNPCWPKKETPNDPGFVLLDFDPYYKGQKPPFKYNEKYDPANKNGV